MEVLAIIPARGGSKGVPRKNIKHLAGKPMIAWTIEAAMASKLVSKVIVSTEDEEIKKISLEYGAEIPFLRSHELAQDDTPGIDPVLFTLKKLELDCNYTPDIVILLQPTSPLRTATQIDEALNTFIDNLTKFDSLISVTELEHPVNWNRRIDDNNKLQDFIEYSKILNYRRQDSEKVYRLNGAIYIAETKVLMDTRSFETEKTMAYTMDRKSSIDIDTMDDFEISECYLKINNKI